MVIIKKVAMRIKHDRLGDLFGKITLGY
jgi:hypothetical protein